MQLSKKCCSCGQEKPLKSFRLRNGKPRSYCRKCEADKSKEWRIEHPVENKQRKLAWQEKYPEKYRRMNVRRSWKKLGFDPDLIESKLATHNGKCEICSQPPKLYKELSVDHCHSTGKFRGFLCYQCNLAVGQFEDRIDLLQSAIKYLARFNSQ